jgi:hypothetical protein
VIYQITGSSRNPTGFKLSFRAVCARTDLAHVRHPISLQSSEN